MDPMDPNQPPQPPAQTPTAAPHYAPPVSYAPPPPFLSTPPPGSNGKKPRVWLWVVIGGGAFFAFLVAVFLLIYFSVKTDNTTADFSGFGEKIAVVDIEG